MTRTRLGLLGLCAVVFGVMALAAGVAQAEVGAKWAILKANNELVTIASAASDPGKGIGDALLPTIQIKEIEALLTAGAEKHVVLLSEAAKLKFEILCTGAELKNEAGASGVKLLLEGSLEHGKVVFSGCVIKIGGVTQAACEPHTGTSKGVIESKPGKGLIVLHNGGPLTRIEPLTGTEFVTVETSEECAIGEKIPVSGKLYLKDSQNTFTTEQVDHLIEQGALTELWTFNKTVEHTANIDGSALVRLTGEHLGLKWAGLPA
jgi:hypothetical protein